MKQKISVVLILLGSFMCNLYSQNTNRYFRILDLEGGSYITVDGKKYQKKDTFSFNEQSKIEFGKVESIYGEVNGRRPNWYPKDALVSRNSNSYWSLFVNAIKNLFGTFVKPDYVIEGHKGDSLVLIEPKFNFKEKSRVALLIANYDYKNTPVALKSPYENVRKVKNKLENLGWGTYTLYNVQECELSFCLKKYRDAIASSESRKEAAIIYYDGHGDANNIRTVDNSLVSIESIVRWDSISNVDVPIYVFDACRFSAHNGVTDLGKIISSNAIVLRSTSDSIESKDNDTFADAFVKCIGSGRKIENEFNQIKTVVAKKRVDNEKSPRITTSSNVAGEENDHKSLDDFNFHRRISYVGIEGGLRTNHQPGIGVKFGLIWLNRWMLETGGNFIFRNKSVPLYVNGSELYDFQERYGVYVRCGYDFVPWILRRTSKWSGVLYANMNYVYIHPQSYVFYPSPNVRLGYKIDKNFQLHFDIGWENKTFSFGNHNYDDNEGIPSDAYLKKGSVSFRIGINYRF